MKQFSFKPAQVFSEYLKIQNIIFTSIQLEAEVLNKHRQFYNPNKFSGQIEKAYRSHNLLRIISAINIYSYNSLVFYSLPLWIISFPFYLFFNFKSLKSAWFKISFSVSEYKAWTKSSLVSNFRGTFNLKIIVSFFPFIFGISYIIYSRYQSQVFTYFIHRNLPGAYPSFPKLRWETFQNIISPQLIPENTSRFFNLDSTSNLNKSSIKAGNSQLATTSVSRLNKFIKRVDFYNDSFLIKLNSNWLNKKKQIYVGIFSENNHEIGNNWHLVSPKDCITFSYILPTKSVNKGLSFTKTGNLTKYKIPSERLNLNQNLIKKSLVSKVLTSSSAPVRRASLLTFPFQNDISTKRKRGCDLRSRFEVFYLNLDELPKKLNSRSIFTSKVSPEKPLEISPSKALLYDLPNVSISKSVENLSLKNYLDEYQNFITNSFSRDIQNHRQIVPVKFLNKNFIGNSNEESKKSGITRKGIIFKYQKIYNLVDRKGNLKVTKPLVIQTLNGFSTNDPRDGFKEVNFTSESLLRNKFNLLQNELKQYFYNNGLKSLPNFSRLATNFNIYDTFLLLREDFMVTDSRVIDQSTQDDNPTFLNLSTSPLNITQTIDSTSIKQNKPVNKRSLLNSLFQSKGVSKEIKSLKNNSKALLANLTLDELVILSELEDYFPEQILHVLQDFGPFKINLAIQPRMMSGYEFPDTSGLELRSLISQYFYQTTASLKRNPLLRRKIENKLEFLLPSFKVELPPSFTSYINYNYPNPKKAPSLKFKYKFTNFEIRKEGKKVILYSGPGVLRDHLSKSVNIINKEEIYEWIKQFLSLENPLADRRQVFFGLNLTKQACVNGDSALKVEVHPIKKHITQTLSFQTGKVQQQRVNGAGTDSINLPIVPFTRELTIPYLNESEWNTIVNTLRANLEQQLEQTPKLEDKLELEKKFQVNIPLINIRNPKQQKIEWPLNQLDYQNLNDVIFNSGSRKTETWLRSSIASKNDLFDKTAILIPLQESPIIFQDITYPTSHVFPGAPNTSLSLERKLVNVNYHYKPSGQILLSENLVHTKIFGNVYKKAFTVYKNIFENKYESLNKYKKINYTDSSGKINSILLNNFSKIFHQSWEPITIGSWMMITQLSFALMVLRILQDFYRKYGKELLSYFLDLIASLGIIDENLKEELGLDGGSKGFRLIRKVPKRFRDIAGIDSILPELGEIVWFLRNSGRSFKVGNIIPKGILLIGSPGTGKTLLVQAIAGEAEVPVLIQSGSSLNDPGQEGGGAQNLKNLFEQAREMAPCIVFIDEIDALGEKRENVIQNPMGADEIIESIQEHGDSNNLTNNKFIPKPKIEFSKNENNGLDREQQDLVTFSTQQEGANQSNASSENSSLGIMQQSIDKQEARQEQLRLLMQFLIEMDGLRARKGVIVIGATNRPEVLDLALTRPGRFDQTLQLGSPKRQKRIDILKLYSRNLGTVTDISWDYLAKRTVGFSAADLAAVMNESSIKAILGETIHTIETIEEGIESITSYSSEKIDLESDNCVDPFFISRLAYYQAGKAVVHTLLLEHPSVTVLHLWPRKKNARHTYISSIIESKFLKISRKLELESRVVGLYAGKAAELLILSNNLSSNLKIGPLSKGSRDTERTAIPPLSVTTKQGGKVTDASSNLSFQEKLYPQGARLISQAYLPGRDPTSQSAFVSRARLNSLNDLESKRLWQSDIGTEDLNFATSLVESMISKWYFYSKNLAIRNSNQIFYHRNLQEISEVDTIDLFNQLAIEIETGIIKKAHSSGLKRDFQKWSMRPWWQTQISRKIGLLDPAYDDWYRIYLPDPQENERNEEWIPPDEYYHNNNNLSDLALNSSNSSINWNNLYASDRDYISHSLLLTCFNTAFTILDKNRELLDYLASYLMRNDILREHEINDILLQFKPEILLRDSGLSINKVSNEDEQQTLLLEKNKKVRIVEKSWGNYSRRKIFHFFKF